MNVIKALEPLLTPIEKINPNPANTRKHNEENIKLIAHGLNVYGQHKPIVVQKNGMICRAGNGVLEAAKSLNWEQIAAVIIDEDSTTATAREIIDNRSAEIGSEWDQEALKLQLSSLSENIDITSIGFSQEDLNALLDQTQSSNGSDDDVNIDDLQKGETSIIEIQVPIVIVEEVKNIIDETLKDRDECTITVR